MGLLLFFIVGASLGAIFLDKGPGVKG